MANTRISWTDAVWNPVTGCSKVSQGCKHCYAERMAQRFAGLNGYPADDPFRVTLHPDKLDLPLRWTKPRKVFVNSMSDLFHKDVPDEFIDRVFAVMALTPQHTFQVLTKRPERMLNYLTGTYDRVDRILTHALDDYPADRIEVDLLALVLERSKRSPWPLPNCWLGVSVENQQAADERIPLLLQTPAAVRFISAEPLLGPVDLGELIWVSLPRAAHGDFPFQTTVAHAGIRRARVNQHGAVSVLAEDGSWLGVTPDEMDWCRKLDWVIVGGESGPGARPLHPDWARSLRDQCQAAGVPIFVKQMGSMWAKEHRADSKGGELNFWPDDLRVREVPHAQG